jgi:deazaflavin-dependent oxidoreductase (nitroreductase family)
MSRTLKALADLDFCYLTTTGRTSGRPRRIEIWFAAGVRPGTVYLLSGGGDEADWVKNLKQNARVSVQIGNATFAGVARILEKGDEDASARRLLAAKYEGWSEGKRLSGWARTSLPVAIDLDP